MTDNSTRQSYPKKEITDACDELVQKGKLVKINPDSKNPSWQETEKFLESVWGVTNAYQTCHKCGEEVNLDQNEFMRMAIGGDWVYLHMECTRPHIGFYAIKHYYENLKGVPHDKPNPHKLTKAERDLIVRYFKDNFSKQSGDNE